ncbi:Hypothetical protein LUCI_1857 [Lucifera butyrica]|uniref:Outer membrane protein beta-barrel domain-containing protein n=1 Tax=Lucifera butyrica TaxID=1351585 RepID=A0A498R5F2_9FIRM|nr:hypothetical protein [Lucifera butyrica]VBB06621.1 Hypothetical protein LUCI_1857 [Lucifera butyrica]
MKKTALLAIAIATILTASVGFAAPQTDYSAGKTSVDLTWRNADNYVEDNLGSTGYGIKGNWDWGITTGLGNNFAFQYAGFNAKSADKVYSAGDVENFELKTQEFNVLYKLDNNISAYAGLVKIKGISNSNYYGNASDSKNELQFGLVGSTKIADKTTAYAQVGIASDFTNWKVGLSQEIAPNLELNLDYRRTQGKNLNLYGYNVDATAKGLGLGITYKF